ncbi:non-canonical purine NTP pyrophosphatase [Sulfitobacter sp. R18_1]|nr:non-canonical purine NTP pyrophosphatase [Sulfitobacter sp. R18_1]
MIPRPLPIGSKMLLASHNKGKMAEISDMLSGSGIEIVFARDLDLPEPVETEETLAGNARLKAHSAAKATGLPALADDSGLEIAALDGRPGVHTADWAEIEGTEYGQAGRDYKIAADRILREIEEKGVQGEIKAAFKTVLCLAWPDGHDDLFTGETPGSFLRTPRGDNGHDLDPYFLPEGTNQTFAEISMEEKNRLSSRAEAIQIFIETCTPQKAPGM